MAGRGKFSDTQLNTGVSRSLIEVYGVMPAELKAWKIDDTYVKGRVLNALRDAGKIIIIQLNRTVATWVEHKVTFQYQTHITGDEASVSCFPTGDIESVNIWNYLNSGTSERWAVMSSNPKWASKTKPGRLVAQAGAGHVVLAGKGQMMAAGYTQPMPGIQALVGPGQ